MWSNSIHFGIFACITCCTILPWSGHGNRQKRLGDRPKWSDVPVSALVVLLILCLIQHSPPHKSIDQLLTQSIQGPAAKNGAGHPAKHALWWTRRCGDTAKGTPNLYVSMRVTLRMRIYSSVHTAAQLGSQEQHDPTCQKINPFRLKP